MVTEQASEHNLSDVSGPLSPDSTEHLLNLLELSNSDLTASTGVEELPVSEMLLDTLIGVLQSERPDLLAHSQRVAFLCFGMGRQFGWSNKRTNTLVTAGLLHDLGMLALSHPGNFWDEVASDEEEVVRYATVDLLETCHADSDLLEILTLSLKFRYREPQNDESDFPTPDHVILGAAAFQFAHLFDVVRHRNGGVNQISEIVGALQTLAETPVEQQAVAALEDWLAGRDKIIHSFDATLFFPGEQDMDEETASFVRQTFIEILTELYNLQRNYDAFFLLDSTGRFQLWNSGCQLHHGYTIREMRNKHWSNPLIGYCNEEGLAFSDAQTPLFQTLETGSPAQTTLFLKKSDDRILKADVHSVPIMGRDKLMLGIVELHRIHDAGGEQSSDILYTPEWISGLAGELRRVAQESPETDTLPDLDGELISGVEARLGFAASELQSPAPPAGSDEPVAVEPTDQIDLDDEESADLDKVGLDPADSDILTEEEIAQADSREPEPVDELQLAESDTALAAVESDTVASEIPEEEGPDSEASLTVPVQEDDEGTSDSEHALLSESDDSEQEDLPELGSHLDDLLSRFDDMVTETEDAEPESEFEAAATNAESETDREPEAASPSDELTEPSPEAPETDEDLERTEEISAWDEQDEQTESEVAATAEEAGDKAAQSTQGDESEVETVQMDAYDSDSSETHLGGVTEQPETSEEESDDPASVFDEDDALSALNESPPHDKEEPHFEGVDEPAEIAESDTKTSFDEDSVLEEPDLDSIETHDSAHALASDDEPDFELNPDAEVTDSELMQALADEEVSDELDSGVPASAGEISEDAPEETTLEEDKHAESSQTAEEELAVPGTEATGEQASEELTEETVAAIEESAGPPEEPSAIAVPEPPTSEEETAGEQITEPVESASQADHGEELAEPERPEERAEDQSSAAVSGESVAEQPEEPAADLAEAATEDETLRPETDEPVAEELTTDQTDELVGTEEPPPAEPEPSATVPSAVEAPEPESEPESPTSSQEEQQEVSVPVADASKGSPSESSVAPPEVPQDAEPVSRSEWDAFVSHLLDPNSPDHEAVAVLFLDLDRFKAINEGFGRQIGDDLLKEISRRLSAACGKRELSCRYGGGQFAISCPGLSLDKAHKRGDQIRKLIERTRFDVLPFQSLTVSIGIAGSEEGDSLNDLMNRAEYCLYNAKRSGRNCVVALSSQQIEEELAQDEDEEITTSADKPFEVVSEFEAMIASDMIVYKLGGFLYDMHAKLLHVDKRHVSMRVGSKGFLPYWGRQDDARPVLIDLELGEGWGEPQGSQRKTKKSLIHIRIRPDGWVRSQETFLKRAQHVLRELKGYFAGS